MQSYANHPLAFLLSMLGGPPLAAMRGLNQASVPHPFQQPPSYSNDYRLTSEAHLAQGMSSSPFMNDPYFRLLHHYFGATPAAPRTFSAQENQRTTDLNRRADQNQNP